MVNVKTIKVESASAAIESLRPPSGTKEDWTFRKLRALLSHQWGKGAASLVDLDGINMSISKSTGKIRHVKLDDEILLTLVPTTGLFTPTYEGGIQLLDKGVEPRYLVTIDDEVSEFVSSGKSALAKFVVEADHELRAGEEVLVVDSTRLLLGVGKALLTGDEMLAFQRGVAVNIRHSRGT